MATPHSIRDEQYILDLCDEVLGCTSLRQYRFDFLRGDANTPLPVDAYYPSLHLVVEYHERQHTEGVPFFDKPDKMTVSGVTRGEQRKRYDELRRQLLPQHGIALVEFSYADFQHGHSKHLLREKATDRAVVANRLAKWLPSA